MSLYVRPYRGEVDRLRMISLAQAFPANNVHAIELPYRMASTAFDNPENICLWEDDQGALQAWIMLQRPFGTIDFALNRMARSLGLFAQMLDWAVAKAAMMAARPKGRTYWDVEVFADQSGLVADLEHAGFKTHGKYSTKAYLTRRFATLPQAQMPEGYSIHERAAIAGIVGRYRGPFGVDRLSAAWRERLLSASEYNPALDLVVVSPFGQAVSYCIGWLGFNEMKELAGQIAPFGVHGSFSRHRSHYALLLECFTRMQIFGAQVLIATTWADQDYYGYGKLGFCKERVILSFLKSFDPKGYTVPDQPTAYLPSSAQ